MDKMSAISYENFKHRAKHGKSYVSFFLKKGRAGKCVMNFCQTVCESMRSSIAEFSSPLMLYSSHVKSGILSIIIVDAPRMHAVEFTLMCDSHTDMELKEIQVHEKDLDVFGVTPECIHPLCCVKLTNVICFISNLSKAVRQKSGLALFVSSDSFCLVLGDSEYELITHKLKDVDASMANYNSPFFIPSKIPHEHCIRLDACQTRRLFKESNAYRKAAVIIRISFSVRRLWGLYQPFKR